MSGSPTPPAILSRGHPRRKRMVPAAIEPPYLVEPSLAAFEFGGAFFAEGVEGFLGLLHGLYDGHVRGDHIEARAQAAPHRLVDGAFDHARYPRRPRRELLGELARLDHQLPVVVDAVDHADTQDCFGVHEVAR